MRQDTEVAPDPTHATSIAAGPSCVDDETLARWADGSIPAAAAVEIESHIAGCVRCLHLVEVFSQTQPGAEDHHGPAPWWQRWWLPMIGLIAFASLFVDGCPPR